MAVLGRLLISSAERLDLPDVLAIDSYAAGDFKYLLKGLVNDTKPYVLKGFDIIDPQNAIGTQTCSIRIADSAVFYPGSNAGPFFYGLPEGDPNSLPLVPELRKNAVNYVYLTFTTFNTSSDSRAFWDPDKDGGVGGEFTQDVNTESVLTCQVNVSVGAFPDNTIPIAKVTVGAVVITAIEDARDMLFRLGTGGLNPDPYATYNWRALPSTAYERNEPPTTMVAGGVNPFEGADKNILSLKEWMDAVMSKLKELGGTIHWYDDASTFSLITMFTDALATTFKSKGLWIHDGTTPGRVTWTEDINIKITADPRTYILRAGVVQLANEQVAYLNLIRSASINNSNAPVSWTNGQPYVNTVGGSVGLFANLKQGDWIRRADDPDQYFTRVEEFYDSVNAGGSAGVSPALAKSIRLSAPYEGPTSIDVARFDRGVYTAGDVVVSDRDAAAIAQAGGNFSWLVIRSDTIENIGNAVTTDLTVSVAIGDGSKALVTTGSAHGLSDGYRVQIAGTADYDGVHAVEVASATTFYIDTLVVAGGVETGTAHYAVITTAARSTPYGLQLESATHGFQTDETVQITDTTNYNGTYQVAVIDSTTFQIATAGPAATETSGTVTLAKVLVRSELGAFSLIQGQSGSIDDLLAQNIKSFLGMTSDNQIYPDYHLPPGFNSLGGTENFNSDLSDNVTVRLSRLTGMMADKAQDKTVKYLPHGLNDVTNTTVGGNQQITFSPNGATLTLLQPGSPGNATVTLPNASPGIVLPANSSAYVVINRNAATTPTIQIASNASLVVGENTFVIATRLSDTNIWLWDGSIFATGTSPVVPVSYVQDRNLKVIKGGAWAWNAGTNTLTWPSDAYVSVPGVSDVHNTILAASNTALTADGMCLYVEINRIDGAAANLTVFSANITAIPLDANALIIARRVGNSVLVGNDGMILIDGESKTLHAGLSVQNRALFGVGVTEATSTGAYSTRGGVNRTMADSMGALDALASIDAEFDKYLGQLRMIAKTAGTQTRVRVTGADRVVFTGETITQELSSLRMSFSGAEIDFATGNIYGGDATLPLSTDFTVPLGVNFTPATITANQYLWYSVSINPSGTNADNTINAQFNVLAAATSAATPALAAKPALGGTKKLGFVVVKDNGAGGSGTVLTFGNAGFPLPAASAQSKIAQLGVGSGSGGGNGLQKVRLVDPVSTTLPTGTVTTDGVSVTAGDLVLYTNLASGNNKIYSAQGTGTSITGWQAQFVFNGSTSPGEADTVIAQEGTGFADAIGTFTGTAWSFNNKVRYFNGADYWEVSSLNSAALANNQVSPADVFAINWLHSENMIMDYSIVRGSTKEVGSLYITTDGSNIGIAAQNVESSGDTGITFSASIAGAVIHIQYVSTNTGSAGQVKWTLKRWSDAAGGPGGIPSYSGGGGGGGGGTPGGSTGDIQFNVAGTFAGNDNFKIDTTDTTLDMNGLKQSVLTSVTIADNIASPTELFSYPMSYTAAIIEYSIVRNGAFRTARLLVANDGTLVSMNGDSVETASIGVPITADLSGGNVRILYTSSATGFTGTFKYAFRKWS